MPDLRDLLSLEAERLRPERVPPFDDVLGRRRRQQRTVRAVSAIAVTALLSTTAVLGPRLLRREESLQPSVPLQPAPDSLVIDCRDAGPVLPDGARVAAQADGVHYTFRNQTDSTMHGVFALGGDTIAPHGSWSGTTSHATPGAPATVSCSQDIETLKVHELPVVIADPQHVFVPVPECNGPTAIRDFVKAMTGDPVGLTLQSHARADAVGYPAGSPRLVYTGDELIAWEQQGNSWVPSQVTQCGTAAPHVVGAGIKAPPPTQLTHTDEFGLVTSVRARGDVIEVDVDRVDMLSGAEAAAAAAAAGADVSNDYFLRNDNPAVRTYRVSPIAVVWGNSAMLHKEPGAQLTTLARWEQFVATPAAKDTLFHFEINDGAVTGIEEQYRP